MNFNKMVQWVNPSCTDCNSHSDYQLSSEASATHSYNAFPWHIIICWNSISTGLNFYLQQLFTCTFYSYSKFLLYGTWSCYKFPPAIQHKMEFHRKASRTYKHPVTTNHILHRTVLFHPPWPLKQQRDTFVNNWDSSSLLNLKNFVFTWRISGEI